MFPLFIGPPLFMGAPPPLWPMLPLIGPPLGAPPPRLGIGPPPPRLKLPRAGKPPLNAGGCRKPLGWRLNPPRGPGAGGDQRIRHFETLQTLFYKIHDCIVCINPGNITIILTLAIPPITTLLHIELDTSSCPAQTASYTPPLKLPLFWKPPRPPPLPPL